MEYKINPNEINNIFAVPASVVDEDLRLAGSAQLKVLLWTLRHAKHENANMQELSDELGIEKADAVDAMQFWLDRGVFIKNDAAPAAPAPAARAVSTKPPVKRALPVKPAFGESAYQTETVSLPQPTAQSAPHAVADIPLSQPSHEQIAARCKESRELCELFSEVQQRLGRTIGYEGQSVLLMLYDTYGLPMPVILMAVEYAVTQGKTNMRYIAGVGKHWCEKEIDTLEKALEYIDSMNSCDKIWERFRELTGIKNPKPTTTQRNLLSCWTHEMGFGIDVIYMAYEEMADHTEKFSMQYMNKVLANWNAEGLHTADDIEKAKQERAAAKRPASSVKSFRETQNASYDLDEHERKAKQSPPVYTKKRATAATP